MEIRWRYALDTCGCTEQATSGWAPCSPHRTCSRTPPHGGDEFDRLHPPSNQLIGQFPGETRAQVASGTAENGHQSRPCVAGATEEVATVAGDTSAATEEVSASAQESAASTQKVASTSDELARLAGELNELVGAFTV